ncbi:hypothetical protein V8E54_013891 [Elaphomyces granulatus]
MLDCREEKNRPAYGEMDEEGIKITYTRYMDRKKDALRLDSDKRQAARHKANEAQGDESSVDESSSEEEDCTGYEAPNRNPLDNVSLLEWLRYYNFKTCTKRPRAKPRCISYYPRYPKTPQAADYAEYCRVKILLHHPFYDMPGLETLQHEDDFLDEPDEPDEPDDDEDLEEADQIQGDDGRVAEVGAAELLAGRNPRIVRNDDPDQDLGIRPSDLEYDWASHAGLYDVFDNWLAGMKSQKLFDTTVDHYRQELADLDPCQLLLNVDGVAGSGKTYTIMQISVMLQEIAGQHDRENPLQQAAPTGLPVKTAFKELPPTSLTAFQRLFRDTRFPLLIPRLKLLPVVFCTINSIAPSATRDTLTSRVANELSPEEVATLDTAIRIYVPGRS